MIKRVLALLLAFVMASSVVWAEEVVQPDEEIQDEVLETEEKIYQQKFFELSQSVSSYNIEDYTVLESEKEEMHNAEQILRRNYEGGIAWVVFEIPYLTEFKAVALHYPQDIENMSYEISKDGENWTEVQVIEEVFEVENKWTKYEYTAENIEDTRYIKVVWGEEAETNHWWTPYFVGLFVNTGEAVPSEIIFENNVEMQIPPYESKKFSICAKLVDQIGVEIEEEVALSVVSATDERIVLNENNEVEITSDMTEGTEFVIRAECGELSKEQTFKLIASLSGDSDGDNKLTDKDADAVIENYGKKVNLDNRLCDINKDGKINIIDLAFVLRYKESA